MINVDELMLIGCKKNLIRKGCNSVINFEWNILREMNNKKLVLRLVLFLSLCFLFLEE